MRRSRSFLFVLAISYPAHACDEATTTDSVTEATARVEGARRHDVEPERARPCPPDMALIPPEPGAWASVPWFCLDRTEVTVAAWWTCVWVGACEPPSFKGPHRPEWMTWNAQRYDLPVNYINQTRADAFCRWAGKRLPSVAEWSWAYRSASSERNVPWGVWKVASEEESRVLNTMPTEAVCRPPPGGERLTTPCSVGTSPGDTTKQGISDMVGNVREWTSDRDDTPWPGARRVTEGPPTQHEICGDSFRTNFFNLAVAGDCSVFPSELAYEKMGVRCASAPDVDLPQLSPFPCPTLYGKLRDDALALLHEYHRLLASGSFDRALAWQTSRIDPRLFAEARLSMYLSDADLAELWSVGGGLATTMLKDGALAPLVPDADIAFACDDWKYTPVTHDGRAVLRVDGADGKPLPFCLRLAATGWVVPCIFPARSGEPGGSPKTPDDRHHPSPKSPESPRSGAR